MFTLLTLFELKTDYTRELEDAYIPDFKAKSLKQKTTKTNQ